MQYKSEAYEGRRLTAKSKDLSTLSMRRDEIWTYVDSRKIEGQHTSCQEVYCQLWTFCLCHQP